MSKLSTIGKLMNEQVVRTLDDIKQHGNSVCRIPALLYRAKDNTTLCWGHGKMANLAPYKQLEYFA